MNVPILRVPVTDVLAGVVVSRFFGAGASGFPDAKRGLCSGNVVAP